MAFAGKIYHEIGLKALLSSSHDVKILCMQRLIRMFAYGSSTLVLTLFLQGLGNDPGRIGLFMTLTLWGDVLVSLMLTLIADKIGRRKMLVLGSLSMTASGITFAMSSKFWILLLASIIGVISPSGNEVGPFKAIEESTLVQLIQPDDRSGVIAWYTLSGTAGIAIGVIVFGRILATLQARHGWESIESYRTVFWAYAALGLIKCLLSLLLSQDCEVKAAAESESDSETEPLIQNDNRVAPGEAEAGAMPVKNCFLSWLPALSSNTIGLLIKLCTLFAFDSVGAGMSSGAWLVYFFHERFGLQEASLGNLFFVTNILSSASNLAAAPLAKRIGLIQTMVFTHLPASIFLLLLPVPDSKEAAIALLVLRSSVTSMDQAPRQAFLAAAVQPQERTTVMGIVNVSKTLSNSVGPIISGLLAKQGKLGTALMLAGGLKCLYDLLMLVMFFGYRTVEEESELVADGRPGSEHEEIIDESCERSQRSVR